jgi:pyruvate/2-oxoglutarate dehydrogenase complex dihydrolipoamide acyltransferase (E2) component
MSTFELDEGIPTWRKVALSSWRQSDDPAISGWLDIDATRLNEYLTQVRQVTNVKVTVTHLVGKAAAIAFDENPECNAVVSFGRLKRRDSVDVFFSVAAGDGKNLSGAKLERVNELSLTEIARNLANDVGRIRDKGDTQLQRSQGMLRRLPGAVLRPVMHATAFAMFDLGVDLGRFGVPYDPLGSVIVSNIGVFGLEQGFAPLIPSGRTAAILTIGAIREKVIVVGNEMAVRPVLTICGTFDHRIVDGYHLGRIAQTLRAVLEDPSRYLGSAHREANSSLTS